MKKILLLLVILALIITPAFAYTVQDIDSNKYQINGDTFIFTSSSPFVTDGSWVSFTGPGFTYAKTAQGEWVQAITVTTNNMANQSQRKSYLTYSSHDLYEKGTSTVTFLGPPRHWVETMAQEGILAGPLKQVLLILPIILGTLVLAIGFRKAWRLLSTSLRGA